MDEVSKMQLDCLGVLLDIHDQKGLNEAASSDHEVLGVLHLLKLIVVLGSGLCVHHVVYNQAMNDEMLALVLLEACILTIDCGVAVLRRSSNPPLQRLIVSAKFLVPSILGCRGPRR